MGPFTEHPPVLGIAESIPFLLYRGRTFNESANGESKSYQDVGRNRPKNINFNQAPKVHHISWRVSVEKPSSDGNRSQGQTDSALLCGNSFWRTPVEHSPSIGRRTRKTLLPKVNAIVIAKMLNPLQVEVVIEKFLWIKFYLAAALKNILLSILLMEIVLVRFRKHLMTDVLLKIQLMSKGVQVTVIIINQHLSSILIDKLRVNNQLLAVLASRLQKLTSIQLHLVFLVFLFLQNNLLQVLIVLKKLEERKLHQSVNLFDDLTLHNLFLIVIEVFQLILLLLLYDVFPQD